MNNLNGMVVFKSVVVLDLETTSLPHLDHNTTKITELACVGCEIEHLKNSRELPRVLHKLVLLFNPNKLVDPTTSDITGLTNELLMNVKPFRKEDVDILREFIARLPSPVCLVAQNGDAFDFPILRRAMVKVDKELQNNVYCLDSLKAFRALLSPANSPPPTAPSKPPPPPTSSNAPSPPLTPSPPQRTVPVNALRRKNVSRELFPERPSAQSPPSFKLNHLYQFYFGGRMADAHRAEGDAKALLACIMRCEGFLEWMNENAIIFNSVQYLF